MISTRLAQAVHRWQQMTSVQNLPRKNVYAGTEMDGTSNIGAGTQRLHHCAVLFVLWQRTEVKATPSCAVLA